MAADPHPAAGPLRVLRGTPAGSGLAYGPVVRATTTVSAAAIAAFEEVDLPPDVALARYDVATAEVAAWLADRARHTGGSATGVLNATAVIVRDRALRAEVAARIGSGERLLAAVRGSLEHFIELFGRAGGPVAGRVSDLRDLEKRLIAALVGEPQPGVPTADQPAVLVAADLAPVDAATLDADTVLAVVTERGGPTGHTAIIARALGIPCVVAVEQVSAIGVGTPVLVDGTTGVVEVEPDAATARVRVEKAAATSSAHRDRSGPARTGDGVRVRLLANVADGASARTAASTPVEGVGLFRTELCFLGRAEEPTVREQTAAYVEVLAAFGAERTVVVRTLDAGSDKPIPFAAGDREANPALGRRGIRVSAGNPGLLERQLDAIVRAAEQTGSRPWVMAPMVATVDEARLFAAAVHAGGLLAGVMVEVPSAAVLADQMLRHVDFLSIGTNDLAQYVMAADRTDSGLAHLTDPWQPAVLALVAITAEAGRRAGKSVGVCGEAAADPVLATALVGMGVTSLSMAVSGVRAVHTQLGGVPMAVCEQAAAAALAAADPGSARDAVRQVLGLDASRTCRDAQ